MNNKNENLATNLNSELLTVLTAYDEVMQTVNKKKYYSLTLGKEKGEKLLFSLLRGDLLHLLDALNVWYQNGMKMLEDEEKCNAEHGFY